MFKKPFKVSSNNSLSGKDKKKLIADLLKYYEPESVNTLLEKNNQIVVLNKLQGSKINIYLVDNIPLFIDATGKGDFFPTVYAVQLAPNLTPAVEINAGVDTFVLGGANLMWPGVKNIKTLGTFNKDDVRYVKTSDNKVVAIGAMACSSQELATKGASGTAMFILHINNDNLWQSGPKKVLAPLVAEPKKEEAAPPAAATEATEGKKKEEAKVDETKADKNKKKEESEEEEEEEEEEDDGADDLAQYFGGMIKKKPAGGAPKPAASTAAKVTAPVATKKTAAKHEDFDDDEDDKKKGKKGGKKGKGGKKKEEEEEPKKKGGKKPAKKGKASEDEDEEEEEDEEDEDQEEEKEETKEGGGSNIPTKIMDEYLMEAFLTALKISVNDKEHLPMDAGDFYSNHLLPCKREGIFIDLKNTSYKKMGKFLQAMTKLGVIDFKESKKGAAPQITRVNRQHQKLMDFEPVVTQAAKKDTKEEEVSEDDKWPKVQIVDLYKIKPQILQFFPEDANTEKLFTHEEITNTLTKYINTHNLQEKKYIKLDEKLRPLFWVEQPESEGEDKEGEEGGKKGVKKVKQPQFTITKEDLFKKLDDYLNHYYKIIDLQTKEEEVKQGNLKGIFLVAEKSHNKNVTRINGLETFKFNINSLVTKFQLRFACSVSTHNYKEKNIEKTEVTVHGNFIDAIVDYLVDECKIDRKYITDNNKLDKKKKERTFQM